MHPLTPNATFITRAFRQQSCHSQVEIETDFNGLCFLQNIQDGSSKACIT